MTVDGARPQEEEIAAQTLGDAAGLLGPCQANAPFETKLFLSAAPEDVAQYSAAELAGFAAGAWDWLQENSHRRSQLGQGGDCRLSRRNCQ